MGSGKADPDVLAAEQTDRRGEAREPGGPGQGSVEDRIDRLEEDVAAIRIALSRLSPTALEGTAGEAAVTDVTAPIMATVASASPSGDTVTALPTAAPGRPTPRDGLEQFAVHLASYKDPAAARRGWRDIAADHPSLIGVLTPVLAQVDLGDQGIFYRLKAGPFGTWDKADAVCKALRALSWTCTVLDFAGLPLSGESARKRDLGSLGP
ncbi:MAG: SPOR domain-containing protein [Alphaproteobacteria bacterium]